jgi:hemerythrin
MESLKWRNEYSVGAKDIDDQHRNLLDTINTLLEEQSDKYEESKFSPALFTLIHYAYTHFATEEQYLLHVHFPDLNNHILEHIDFIMKTLDLALKVKNSNDESRLELLEYLTGWYSSHVLGTDRKYIPFLASKESI